MRNYTIFIFIFLLGGCFSSGGSDSAVNAEANILSGKIVGLKVEGLKYQTESQSGKTNSESGFYYKRGETVSFSIGSIEIGSVIADSEITLFDISGASSPEDVAFSLEKKMEDLVPSPIVNWREKQKSKYPFEGLSNLLVFLIAIDKDGVFTNGITIPEQLFDIVTDIQIDIRGTYIFSFAENLHNSKLLEKGVSAGVWSQKPLLMEPMEALDAFYTSIDEVPQTYIVSRLLLDIGNDGTINSSIRNTFDKSGKQIGRYEDTDNDGISEYQHEWAFDAQGHEILNQEDNDGDGFFESYTSRKINYHSNGYVSSVKATYEYEIDESSAREVRRIDTSEFDESGRQILVSYWYKSSDGHITSYTTSYSRDSNGNILAEKEDTGSDGSIDKLKSYKYNSKGLLIRSEYDSNYDGIADTISIYDYDESGRQIFYSYDGETYGTKEPVDGMPDYIATNTYDSYGNLTSSKEDYGADGVYEKDHTWERTYDSEGRVLSIKFFDKKEPENSSLITYEFDLQGRQVATSVDNHLDGVVDRTSKTVFHDEFGGYTSNEYDSSGLIIWTQSSFFDEQGNHLEWFYDNDGDGIANQGWKRTYNSNNLVIKKSTITNGKESYYESYQYDDQGKKASSYHSHLEDTVNSSGTVTFEYHNLKSWKKFYLQLLSRWEA